MKQSLQNLKPLEALWVAVLVISVVGVTMIGFGWMPHLSIILVLCGLMVYGRIRGIRFQDMQQQMAAGVMSGIGAIYLFFFIGLLVSALMMAGTIPTIMYYGFDLISPRYYYLSAFLLTSIVGIAIGSSLTTCATLGVAFIGMSQAFQADPAIAAGAIVSGAFFGDKMSPLSDTTGIAASIVGIDLFEHIRNMMYTTVPAFALTALFLWLLAGNTGGSIDSITSIQNQLQQSGLVHWYSLLPLAVLLVLALRKVGAIYTIMTTIAVALPLTYLHSKPGVGELGNWFFNGYTPAVDLGDVGRLISRGGISSMFFTQTIVVLALSMGGLLAALGVLPALLDGIRHLLHSAGRVTFAAASTALGVNILVGEQYLSLLLAGETFKSVYDKLNLHPRNLSRTLEDAGTVINPLVPWSVCGVFISHALGVPVLDYLPYAFFCYLCLLLTLLFGFSGITLSRKEN
ncbi:sodium:proton antiporter [Neisseria arctica]|uniref:Sodium:proton antiporter n=1 Tax=Neisseria arctica TaxID=1470200 RepID=A0A0J1C435_9NEIS|nr:Na+/H+ antiporter NhaC [Neisseria arctica]KLT73048.1 sodium:proton antiporter [Neisseria arctica]UOO86767.1 Na+/H+ antiporter NhaC [Neisseria arctica]